MSISQFSILVFEEIKVWLPLLAKLSALGLSLPSCGKSVKLQSLRHANIWTWTFFLIIKVSDPCEQLTHWYLGLNIWTVLEIQHEAYYGLCGIVIKGSVIINRSIEQVLNNVISSIVDKGEIRIRFFWAHTLIMKQVEDWFLRQNGKFDV